ncbi:MAG: hypothetical protein H0T47_00865 [Planctomycetaceae bacterium]|nr:hypothetical protein [Planctomycetaceae bacterium]
MAALLIGCGPEVSHYQQTREGFENASAGIIAKGGSALEKNYPQGNAWLVDLSKVAIDDEVVEHVKSLGRITELNLSGSTVNDEQLASLATTGVLGYLIKLDVSDTAITDRGLVATAPLVLLSDVNAKGSKVTDAGIAEFKTKHPSKNPFGLKLKIEK